MTQFGKVRWETDTENVRLDIEFSKVNKEKRLVSGWATLDNVDTQGDRVLAEASLAAFSRARGNLREMHKKDSAVGRIVSFKEDTFKDAQGNSHRGIFVTAYVSRGAQDTWEKVLDGTLSAFSIGGSINTADEDWNKDSGEKVRVIKDYDLTELSLVDNPGNPLANIFHIQKSADGSVTVEGLAADTDILNVFCCDEDSIIQEKEDDVASCPVCEEKMTNIGWVESGDDSDDKVSKLIAKYLNPTKDVISKGGDNVPKQKTQEEVTDESVETGHEAGDPTEVPTPAEPADEAEAVEEVPDEELEKTVAVEEVHDDEEEVLKKINELREVVEGSLEVTRSENQRQVDELKEQIDHLQKSFTTQTSQFEAKFNELENNFEVAKSSIARFEKSLDKINSQGAFRKSIDSEESKEDEQNTDPWQGSAFSVHEILSGR